MECGLHEREMCIKFAGKCNLCVAICMCSVCTSECINIQQNKHFIKLIVRGEYSIFSNLLHIRSKVLYRIVTV